MTGEFNILIGDSAGWNLTTGHHNVIIGDNVGLELREESYRFIVKTPTVDVDCTMTPEEATRITADLFAIFKRSRHDTVTGMVTDA